MHLRKVSPQCIIIRGQFVGVNKPSHLNAYRYHCAECLALHLNLAYSHLRLDEIFAKDEWFGSVNVHYSSLVTFCSFHQSMMELSLSVSAITNKLGCMTSVNIWQICVDYNELTINERQKK